MKSSARIPNEKDGAVVEIGAPKVRNPGKVTATGLKNP
jgi:hypothetical protein